MIINRVLIEGVKLKTSSDCLVGIEGAYFLNPYFGVGGRASLSRMRIIVNDVKTEDNSVDALKLGIGAYFSYPLSNRWLVGSRLLPEFVHYRPNLKSIETSTHSRIGIGQVFRLLIKPVKVMPFVSYLITTSCLQIAKRVVNTCIF